MNAEAFRQLYEYHFRENRKMWDEYVASLPFEQYRHEAGYSHGSVRGQVLHLINVDEAWFSGLRGVEPPQDIVPADFDARQITRARWDNVENHMRAYLASLRDDMLFTLPFADGEDKDVLLWQVLIHVVNHGTDHRAQIRSLLNDLGVKTGPQDYMFHVYEQAAQAGGQAEGN